MATTANLRARRSAAQLHALAGVEREIRANDPNSGRKYLKDYAEAFRSYETILDASMVQEAVRAADILLIGDYHALPASQRFAATVLEQRALAGDRPVVLGLETILARDQHILDEWWRREIEQDELRERIRFEREWGYEWTPFYELLVAAREHGEAIYGLDCMPREDLRKIGARDRHAADKLAEIRGRHPGAVLCVLFGESHLAPQHLPCALRERLPEERVLTVLQNVDALYWRVAGERPERIEAVRVNANTICVFNATPLEKYEHYRLCLDRWKCEDSGSPDLGPTINNLIDGLVRFLGINRYSAHNSTQPRFLVDLLPEVYCPSSDAMLRRLLSRKAISEAERAWLLGQVERQGCVYFPQINALYIREFQMTGAAEAAARFLHHACRGLPQRRNGSLPPASAPQDRFYRNAVEEALTCFGARVLHPALPAVREASLRELSELTREDLERQTGLEFPEAVEAVQLVLRHRERERSARAENELRTEVARRAANQGMSTLAARQLGLLTGSDLYDAYLEGRVRASILRSIFLAHLEEPGQAAQVYFGLVRRLRAARPKAQAESVV